MYVLHDSDKSYLIKHETHRKTDTTVFVEKYFILTEPSTVSELKRQRLLWFIQNQGKLNLDSVRFLQSMEAYYVDNIPMKIYHRGKNNQLTAIQICTKEKNHMFCNSYFVQDTLNPFQTDEILWNQDSTSISWKINSLDRNMNYDHIFLIKGNSIDFTFKDVTSSQIQFHENENMFYYLLQNKIAYADDFLELELPHFEKSKIQSMWNENTLIERYEYTYDNAGKIIQQDVYTNNRLVKKVVYSLN